MAPQVSLELEDIPSIHCSGRDISKELEALLRSFEEKSGRPFIFEQRGGRCKLVEGDEFTIATIAKAVPKRWEDGCALRPARLAKDWEDLQIYMQKNNLKHVNEVKLRWFGLSWSYPLHKAAKDHDLRHMTLLLRFGANLWQKDSRGKTALDYICLEALQWNMIREYENAQSEQRPSAQAV